LKIATFLGRRLTTKQTKYTKAQPLRAKTEIDTIEKAERAGFRAL
jgi:hypothetical protein